MIKNLLRKIFGTRNERLIKNYLHKVNAINALEKDMKLLTDAELKNKTLEFKNRLNNNESLDAILIESFAVCREASLRTLNMRHFDVQLIGGMVLHENKIAEMKTGEGKTLVATLAAYLNALNAKGVHIVTVNDYLAKRDANEMGKLFNFLGLTVGINVSDLTHEEKKQAYLADITYGTNNEFGFDYLRDNMVFDVKNKVQRKLNFAIIDEVDSILIDEARTPLIISGMADGSDELYLQLDKVPNQLVRQESEDSDGDFWVDEKNRNVVLSEAGHIKVEQILTKMGLLSSSESLYSAQNISLMHHLLAALKAHYVYLKDQDYVIQDGEILIVDEFTGRLMSGRRWSDGLHQAVEAKEKVKIERENQTLASITFQNYFRMYNKLSGMTGTADTEAYEFQQIYNLETVVIPTNQPMIRLDYNDKIYMTLKEKYTAIVSDIKECNQKGQPVLVGTTSVENSEIISDLLKKAGLKHEVLNAKQHAKEAQIIIQAGSPNSITVATNMAGRGTDIILGGNIKPEIELIQNNNKLTDEQKHNQIQEILQNWQMKHDKVIQAGGLAIIGTERHESRRIDNQLRGRSGRQGDIGSSRFYLSLDDPLLRIFGGERMRLMMQRFGIKDGESIEHKWLSRSIESAQRKVEGHNFDIRKQLLEYDNIFNDQRQVIYKQRDEILLNEDLSEITHDMIQAIITKVIENYWLNQAGNDDFDKKGLATILATNYSLHIDVETMWKNDSNITCEQLTKNVVSAAKHLYDNKLLNFKEHLSKDIQNLIVTNIPEEKTSWQVNVIDEFCFQNNISQMQPFVEYVKNNPNLDYLELRNYILQALGNCGQFFIIRFERSILLQQLDYYWREHLTMLEYLRQSIHLRGYAQKDPKREFQTEAFSLFADMLDNVKSDIVKMLLTIKLDIQNIDMDDELTMNESKIKLSHQNLEEFTDSKSKKISRNSLCPCGSNKKYKHCHGKIK